MRKFLIQLISIYQIFLSPMLGQNCRFTPSCSKYLQIAINKRGVIAGLYLGCKRLLRCGPWSFGGYEEPPEKIKPKQD